MDSRASKDDWNFGSSRGVSLKGPMEIKWSWNIVSVRLIRDNITIIINSVIGWQCQHGFHDGWNFYLCYG